MSGVKMVEDERFEYNKCTGIKDLYIDDNDDQFLHPTQIVKIMNEQYSFIQKLLKENEEYEEESEDMQTKINVLYHEAKKHMSSAEWKNFNRRIIEREEELGIKWVRL